MSKATIPIVEPGAVCGTSKMQPPAAGAPKHILVMDDEGCMRTALKATLESQGYQVDVAVNGEEAVDLYAKAHENGTPFDAVLLDLTIRGGMGGRQTLEALLKLDPQVQAIVMSGYSEDPVVIQPAEYGFKAAMEKSFDTDQLMSTLDRVLSQAVSPERP